MPRFKIKLANKIIDITCLYKSTKRFCKDYLVSSKKQKPDITIHITLDDIDHDANSNKWLQDYAQSYEYFETLTVYRKIAESLISFNTLLIHGSVISVDNEAYIFIAPSGTGKSTHTKLWLERFGSRAKIVNDDKPLIIVEDDKIYACGSPWSGKHNLNSNIIVPLKGMCFLYRNEVNIIEKLPIESAYEYALLQTYRSNDENSSLKTLDLLDKLLSSIPFYKMGVNNFSNDAIDVSYQALSNNPNSPLRLRKYLQDHGCMIRTIEGYSMEPLLHNRESLIIINKLEGLAKKYDTVLFIRPTGRHVLHRVIAVHKKHYIICGDNQWKYERVPHDWVIAVMTEFSSDGKTFTPVTDSKYLKYVTNHYKYYWIKYYIMLVGTFPERLFQKIKRLVFGG